jgi:sugar phosphate isomerase/epimerase
MVFPTAARERIAIASYPFREFIAGRDDKAAGGGKLELKEFAAHVSAKFDIRKIEPWSAHFRSLEKAYLEELRAAVVKAGGAIVNIAVDGEHSPYAADSAERERAVAFSKQWIDAAAAIGSPSVRTNIPPAKDAKPDVERTAESLRRVAEYGARRTWW